MEDIGLQLCPKCGQPISYSYYFKTYVCYNCDYYTPQYIEEEAEIPRYYINNEDIDEIMRNILELD